MDSLSIGPAGESDCGDILAVYAPYVENTSITFEMEVTRPETRPVAVKTNATCTNALLGLAKSATE